MMRLYSVVFKGEFKIYAKVRAENVEEATRRVERVLEEDKACYVECPYSDISDPELTHVETIDLLELDDEIKDEQIFMAQL